MRRGGLLVSDLGDVVRNWRSEGRVALVEYRRLGTKAKLQRLTLVSVQYHMIFSLINSPPRRRQPILDCLSDLCISGTVKRLSKLSSVVTAGNSLSGNIPLENNIVGMSEVVQNLKG